MDDYAEENRTEFNCGLRSGKSEAEVTNNSRLRSRYCRLQTDTKHRAASLRQQSYLFYKVDLMTFPAFSIPAFSASPRDGWSLSSDVDLFLIRHQLTVLITRNSPVILVLMHFGDSAD